MKHSLVDLRAAAVDLRRKISSFLIGVLSLGDQILRCRSSGMLVVVGIILTSAFQRCSLHI